MLHSRVMIVSRTSHKGIFCSKQTIERQETYCRRLHRHNLNKIYREKSIPMIALQHSVVMADFLMHETQHPIIYSYYFDYIYSSYFL